MDVGAGAKPEEGHPAKAGEATTPREDLNCNLSKVFERQNGNKYESFQDEPGLGKRVTNSCRGDDILSAGGSWRRAPTNPGGSLSFQSSDALINETDAGTSNQSGEEGSENREKSVVTANDSEPLLSWLKVSVKTKRGRDLVLGTHQGMVRQGEVMAIMGLSGSGKSTLISALVSGAQPSFPSTLSKGCLMEGTVWTAPKTRIGYCQDAQHTRILEDLTVRQWLHYRTVVGAPSTPELIVGKKICQIAHDLGLGDSEVLDTPIKYISAGQRVRTTVASEMMLASNDPLVLVCDEPLSALDSATSLMVMKTLKALVQGTNKALILSLHQPRPEVFQLCDKVLLVHEGHQVFCGPRGKAMSIVKSCCLDDNNNSVLDHCVAVPNTDQSAHFLLDAMVVSHLSPAEMGERVRELDEETCGTSCMDISTATNPSEAPKGQPTCQSPEPNQFLSRLSHLLSVVLLLIWQGRYTLLKPVFSLLTANLLLGAIAWNIGDTYGSVFLLVCLVAANTGLVAQGLPAITDLFIVVSDDLLVKRQKELVFSAAFLILCLMQSTVHVLCSIPGYFMGGLSGGSEFGVFALCIFGYMMFLTIFMYQALLIFTHRGWTFNEVLVPTQTVTVLLPVIIEFAAGLMIPYALTAVPFLGMAVFNPLGSAIRAILRHRQDQQTEILQSLVIEDVIYGDDTSGGECTGGGYYYGIGSSMVASDELNDSIVEQFFFRLFDTTYSTYVYVSILFGIVFTLASTFCISVHFKCKRQLSMSVSVGVKSIGFCIFVGLIWWSLAKLEPMRQEGIEFSFNSDLARGCPDCINSLASNATLADLLMVPEVLINAVIRTAALESAIEGSLQNIDSGVCLSRLVSSVNGTALFSKEEDFWDIVPNTRKWTETDAKTLVSLENAEGRLAKQHIDLGVPLLERLTTRHGDFPHVSDWKAIDDSLMMRLNTNASAAMIEGRLYVWKPCPGGDDLERNSLSANESDHFKTVNARVLFYHHNNGTLATVALRLGNADMPLLLPNEMDVRCWDIARAHARHSMATLGGLMRHIVLDHGVAGAFAIATRNSLPNDHPVSRFLLPHLSLNSILDNGFTFITNAAFVPFPGFTFRQGLPVMKGLSGEYNFLRERNLTEIYNEQGLYDIATRFMPMHEAFWDASMKYALQFVERYFSSDSDIANDKSLRLWIETLTAANVHGLTIDGSHHLSTRKNLAAVLAGVLSGLILNHSLGHSSLLRDLLYIPYVPFAIRSTFLPGPTSQCSLEDQVSLYGDPNQWQAQINFLSPVMMPTPSHLSTARTKYTADLFDDYMKDLQDAVDLIDDLPLRNSVFKQLSATQHL